MMALYTKCKLCDLLINKNSQQKFVYSYSDEEEKIFMKSHVVIHCKQLYFLKEKSQLSAEEMFSLCFPMEDKSVNTSDAMRISELLDFFQFRVYKFFPQCFFS